VFRGSCKEWFHCGIRAVYDKMEGLPTGKCTYRLRAWFVWGRGCGEAVKFVALVGLCLTSAALVLQFVLACSVDGYDVGAGNGGNDWRVVGRLRLAT
jgi:hypothetical protein